MEDDLLENKNSRFSPRGPDCHLISDPSRSDIWPFALRMVYSPPARSHFPQEAM